MTNATATLVAPSNNTAHLYGAQFLARYNGATRDLYGTRLRIFFAWCATHNLDPITGITRPLLELYSRHLEDDRANCPASVAGALSTLKMFYRLLALDNVIPASPAEYIRMPKVWSDETKTLGLDRLELSALLATARTLDNTRWALVTLLGLLGLRVSEACNVQIENFLDREERGHRIISVIGKGHKPATMPLPVPVARALDACRGDRTTGPLLLRADGEQLDRCTAARWVKSLAKRAGIRKRVSPHSLRHAMVTNALDAGVPLRDVQIAARHSDPRTTNRYDRARGNLDRHAVHTLAAYISGGA
ncbi:tyrosine-type recombinase/integrase [Nocardioides jensenii]|uniref:tyrosine-type recombinase/integrase n=1 Tax=Nocardioides jensenii TaxID=1843 RepID=UPI000AACC74C|nr:tyrosine-type recombinase/integrase [Nocardioides jensenii]